MLRPFPLVLETGLDGVAPDDDLALRDGRVLVRLLRDEGFEPARSTEPAGTKGGEVLVPIIEIVVSGGGIAGLVKIIDSWLKNRGGRSLTMRRGDDGRSIEITSSNLSESGIAEVVRALTDPGSQAPTPAGSADEDGRQLEPDRNDRTS